MSQTSHRQPKGTLIIIGGHEERSRNGGRTILSEVARRAGRNEVLVILTIASTSHPELGDEYAEIFSDLGVRNARVLPLRSREAATDPDVVKQLGDAAVVFFTGGDQLRITSQLGDTPTYNCLHELYKRGATIAGTSAGAAAMSETMLVGGKGDESPEISALRMAPGLGLLEQAVVDSHFAERGRFGRLLGAVAQNPANLGIGLDEDTAIIVEGGRTFRVIGSGGVYVFDAARVTYSSLSEERAEGVVSIHGVTVHVLAADDCFDLRSRRPGTQQES
jgi:cyanophycinase